MITHLHNFGCSYAHGALTDKNTSTAKILCKKNNLTFVNHSSNGFNNEGILRRLQNYILKDNKNSVVLIMWSSPIRREYIYKKDNEYSWCKYKEKPAPTSDVIDKLTTFIKKTYKEKKDRFYLSFPGREKLPVSFFEQLLFRTYQQVLFAQSLLKSHNIPYIMTWGFENITVDDGPPDIKNAETLIDKKYFPAWNTSLDTIAKELNNYGTDRKHPGDECHNRLANLLDPTLKSMLLL